MNNILAIRNLTKKYGNIIALDKVNISLERGRIYALIGRNGAGKTTLMKIISGLAFQDEGQVLLFNSSNNLDELRKRVGVLINSPGIYKDMTAKQNMEFHRIIRGIPDNECDKKLLKAVGIDYDDKKKVKNFSLEMRQRLGIAISLLGNPEFLILDEPLRGINSEDVKNIENLLLKLCNERNMTIFISSHILSELYSIATDYIFIDKGVIKKEITSKEICEKLKKYILLCTDNPEKMAYVLESTLKTKNYLVMPDKSIKLYDYLDEKEKVAQAFLDNKILVTNFSCESSVLENYFDIVVGDEEDV